MRYRMELIGKKLLLAGWIVALFSLSGCAGSHESVLKSSAPARNDVFEIVDSSRTSSEKALLTIEFPVKTFKARLITTYFKHSDPPYTVNVTIDGQTVVLESEPVLETTPGDFKVNPEAGTGWKYVFNKSLLLTPGLHQVRIAVQQAGVVLEQELTVAKGKNRMKIIPRYNASVSRLSSYPKFSYGLQKISVELRSNDS